MLRIIFFQDIFLFDFKKMINLSNRINLFFDPFLIIVIFFQKIYYTEDIESIRKGIDRYAKAELN